MKRKGDCTDEIIKQLVKRNLQNDKRKNIMIIVAVSLAAFLISFFWNFNVFIGRDTKKSGCGYLRSRIFRCFRT